MMIHRVSLQSVRVEGGCACPLVVFLILLRGSPVIAAPPCEPLPAPLYSFDRNSPTVLDGTVNATDVLAHAEGNAPPNVFLSGQNLGLGPADDLDALSRGYNVPLSASFVLLFSVDGNSPGAAPPSPIVIGLGTPYNVSDQAARNQQAGDQYLSLRLGDRLGLHPTLVRGPATNNNTLSRNNWDEGGISFNGKPPTSAGDVNTRGVEPQDNVDAMAVFLGDTPSTIGKVFFSIASTGMPGITGADILVDFAPTTPGGENFFLHFFQMGLSPSDDIDGLVVFDDNGNGQAEEGDQVLFSLRPNSPFLINSGFHAADVLSFVYQPPLPPMVTLYAQANDLGLGPADRIDALDIALCTDALDCAQRHGIRETTCVPAVSEWGMLILSLLVMTAASLLFRCARTMLPALSKSTGRHRWGCSRLCLALILGVGARHSIAGTVNLQLRPASTQAACGETVDLDLYAISADGVNDLVAAIAVIFNHDPSHLELVGLIDTSPYPWLVDYWPNDATVDRINNDLAGGEFCTEQSCVGPPDCSALGCPPQCSGQCSYNGLPYNDGTSYANWLGQFINPPGFFQATPGPTGALVGTIRFRVIAGGSSQVTILPSFGSDTETAVYDGTVPNFNVLGSILAPLPTVDSDCCTSDADCPDTFCAPRHCDLPSGTCVSDLPPDCDDGLFCNGLETCNTRTEQCEPGTPPVCPGTTDCANGVCDPNADGGAGACVVVSKPDFTICSEDGNDCTVNACVDGTCTAIPLPGCTQFLDATVQLSPPVIPEAFDRCICFDLLSSCTPRVSSRVCTEMTFGGPKNFAGQAQAVIRVPAGQYVCVSAFDPLHTVVATDFVPISTDDTLSASFTGDVAFGGNWLTQGNVDGSCEIDNADASAVAALLGTNYGTGNTTCSTPAPHADFNGDGVVDAVDQSSVSAGDGTGSTDCCEEPPTVCNGECTVIADCGMADDCIVIACTNGICVLNPPGTPCLCATQPDGTPCAFDGNDCTDDVCQGGTCAHPHDDANACDDGNACTINDGCSTGACTGTSVVVLYGDVFPAGGNGVIDVDDLLCVVEGFSGVPPCDAMSDIFPCGGNGVTDVDDILAELDAFSGTYACPHPCPP